MSVSSLRPASQAPLEVGDECYVFEQYIPAISNALQPFELKVVWYCGLVLAPGGVARSERVRVGRRGTGIDIQREGGIEGHRINATNNLFEAILISDISVPDL